MQLLRLVYPDATNIEAGAQRGPVTGPAPAAGGAALFCDAAVGQRLLQFGDTGVGDFGAVEVHSQQIGQPLEMHQSAVGDPICIHSATNHLHVGHAFQLRRSSRPEVTRVMGECVRIKRRKLSDRIRLRPDPSQPWLIWT